MALRASCLLCLLASLPLLAACGAQGEPVGTAEEAITVCPSGSTVKGVDVSHYDGTVHWAAVKTAGYGFAFAKATEGTTYTDPTFATNWAGMKQAGVIRGAYHFFHANVDPTTEATHFLSVMGTLESGDLPPTLDLEVTDNESAATVTANAITWLDAVAAATGTKPILYASTSFISSTLGSPAGLDAHAQLWVADWQVTCPDVPAPFKAWSFWQSSATGTVSGIPGATSVDIDAFDGNLAALQGITVGSASSSGSTTSSSSSTSSSGGVACTVHGVAGTCLDTTVCAAMSGYVSTPGYCPGAANIECCTSTSSSTSSSSTSSSGGADGGTSSGGTGGAGTGGSGGSGSGGKGVNTPSGCAVAPGDDGGAGARALLTALATVALARRSRRRASPSTPW